MESKSHVIDVHLKDVKYVGHSFRRKNREKKKKKKHHDNCPNSNRVVLGVHEF
jgi:hypothetical protein